MKFLRRFCGRVGLSGNGISGRLATRGGPGAGFGSGQGKPALYEFGAGYCASCKEMEKVIAALKTSHGGQVEFRMVYVDKEKPLFEQYKIMLIPTQVFLDASGKEVDRHMGALTKEEVLKKLQELKLINK